MELYIRGHDRLCDHLLPWLQRGCGDRATTHANPVGGGWRPENESICRLVILKCYSLNPFEDNQEMASEMLFQCVAILRS